MSTLQYDFQQPLVDGPWSATSHSGKAPSKGASKSSLKTGEPKMGSKPVGSKEQTSKETMPKNNLGGNSGRSDNWFNRKSVNLNELERVTNCLPTRLLLTVIGVLQQSVDARGTTVGGAPAGRRLPNPRLGPLPSKGRGLQHQRGRPSSQVPKDKPDGEPMPPKAPVFGDQPKGLSQKGNVCWGLRVAYALFSLIQLFGTITINW